jgi:2-polyprenyl-3-methyl-5-hydroxy-6-metoxy-1,4-benzoquinol methylase
MRISLDGMIFLTKSESKIYQNSGNEDVLSLINEDGLMALDIGCGAGSLAKKLIAKGKIVDGISISLEELKQAEPALRRAYLFNVENGLPSEIESDAYDYIICSHILEHIAYPEKLFEDIRRVLKNNGYLIVALPNLFHYKTRIELLKGNFPSSDAGIWDYTHLRWYTYKSAKEILSKNFIIETATVTGELPFNRLFKKIFPKKLSQFFYTKLIKISKGLFGYQLLYRLINKK